MVGPGHWWPYTLVPAYWLAERFAPTRDQALRLGLVTVGEIVQALVAAVQNPPSGVRIVDVPAIRARRG